MPDRIRHVEVVALPEKPDDEGFAELPELPGYLERIDKRNSELDAGEQLSTSPEANSKGDENLQPEMEGAPGS